MTDELDEVIRQILQDYRHLMTEAERRADRAFVFQEKMQEADDPQVVAKMTAAMREALEDRNAEILFEKGRECFLRDVARRVVAKHGATLPRCDTCGAVLKTPKAKECFACDDDNPAVDDGPS